MLPAQNNYWQIWFCPMAYGFEPMIPNDKYEKACRRFLARVPAKSFIEEMQARYGSWCRPQPAIGFVDWAGVRIPQYIEIQTTAYS